MASSAHAVVVILGGVAALRINAGLELGASFVCPKWTILAVWRCWSKHGYAPPSFYGAVVWPGWECSLPDLPSSGVKGSTDSLRSSGGSVPTQCWIQSCEQGICLCPLAEGETFQ